MPCRCKLTAKQNLFGGKIKKGDVITFITPGNLGNPDHKLMCQALANYVGEKDIKRMSPYAQWHQYDIKYELM